VLFPSREKVPAAEHARQWEGQLQEQLRFHRQIVYDLAARFLEPLPGSFARLAYISSLRNAGTGMYEHAELCLNFRSESVHQTLAKCHEELFERVLELPLAEQEEDLRGYIYAVSSGLPESVVGSKDLVRSWIPEQAPDYLKDLFLSNWQVLCELFPGGESKARSNK
jgi:hypothetical protein